VSQDVPDLERRLTELQSQINRLSLSLHLWHERQERRQPVEDQITQVADQCSEMVDRWALTTERQAHAIGQLEQRLVDEWRALNQSHDEPLKELRDQAATLGEVCVAASTQAMSGLERTEARLAGLQSDFRDGMGALSDQLQLAVAELRSLARPARPTGAGTWPLDDVVRLHNQLRGELPVHAEDDDGDRPRQPFNQTETRLLPGASEVFSQRIETLERAVAEGQTELRAATERNSRVNRLWWAAAAVLLIGVAAAGMLATRLQQQVREATAQVADAQARAQAATEAANRQISEAQAAAARQIEEARETALKAQTISYVLSAPDLVRYNLVGRDREIQFSAQALWSRSRGLVFSGSRLPAPPPDSTYQIWILSAADPVSVGTFEPDGGGRFTLATPSPPKVAPPIAGVSVTVERAGGSPRPTGVTLLARAE
jgi:hypothetical protein